MSVLGPVPLLGWVVWGINYVLLVWLVALLDRLVGARSLFPLDNVLVAIISLNEAGR